MTSKEAIQKLKYNDFDVVNELRLYQVDATKMQDTDTRCLVTNPEECWKAIERDLAVLEMFKKHLYYDEPTKTFTIETAFWKADDDLVEQFEYWQKHNAEYNKIKEWLNDK